MSWGTRSRCRVQRLERTQRREVVGHEDRRGQIVALDEQAHRGVPAGLGEGTAHAADLAAEAVPRHGRFVATPSSAGTADAPSVDVGDALVAQRDEVVDDRGRARFVVVAH